MLSSENMGNVCFQKQIKMPGIWYSFCEDRLVLKRSVSEYKCIWIYRNSVIIYSSSGKSKPV